MRVLLLAQRLFARQMPVTGSRRSEAWALGCVMMWYVCVGHEASRDRALARTEGVDCSWALEVGISSLDRKLVNEEGGSRKRGREGPHLEVESIRKGDESVNAAAPEARRLAAVIA